MTDVVVAQSVKSAIHELNKSVSGLLQDLDKSVKKFSDSSDALNRKMIVIMGMQLFVAIVQLVIAFKPR